MNGAWIVRAETVTPLGGSLDESWGALLAGRSAIATVERFSTGGYVSSVAATVSGLEADGTGSLFRPLLGRLLERFGAVPSDCRLLTATTKGGIDVLEGERRGALPSADDALPQALPEEAARRLGLRDAGININAACASSTIALARGAAMIGSGQADAVVVCCLDLVSEFVFSGFSALQALSPHPSRPFDRQRSGLTLGEGAAALLLMSPERARREGEAPLARISGWGVANDANHITAPARDGCGLVQAVRQALGRAQVLPEAVAAVSAHGTGTVYNDLMELTAFETLFGAHRPPIHSVKGALGHTLGAAGGIEAALGVRSLAEGVLPPTVGLVEPEEKGEGQLSAAPLPVTGNVLLSTNSGFGGINAALILEGVSRS